MKSVAVLALILTTGCVELQPDCDTVRFDTLRAAQSASDAGADAAAPDTGAPVDPGLIYFSSEGCG